jgi:hypothetical protein
MVRPEVIFRAPSESCAGYVVNLININKRFIPINLIRRIVQRAIDQLQSLILQVSQIARAAHETSHAMTEIEESIDKVASDETAAACYQVYLMVARLGHVRKGLP